MIIANRTSEDEDPNSSNPRRKRGPKSVWDGSSRLVPRDAYGWLIESLLFALLAFAPFAFGAVEPWAELVVVVLALMLGTCAAMQLLLYSEIRRIRSWAFVPLLLFLALAASQLVALPAKLLEVFSPATVATRTRFLSDLPGAAELLKAFPLSLYPHATRHDLRLVFAASAIFFAVVNYYRRPGQIKRLLAGIILVGAGLAALAFAQDLSGTSRIYFVGPITRDPPSAGSFVLYSHFCQFMNLCVGAALALLLLLTYGAFGKRKTMSDRPYGRSSATLRSIWLLAAFVILGVTTIFLSRGRAGMLATALGFGFVTLLLSRNKAVPGRGWLVLPLVLLVLGALSFVGLEAVYNRLGTLREAQSTDSRLQIVKDLTHVWKQYPLFGTGLGTHEVVYPRFDRSTISFRASHAEDEYAQVTEEMGFVGLGLVLWFAATIWWNFVRVLRSGEVASQLVVTGLGFGLLAVMMHSFTDFGQHVPAVACLTATFCGLMISVARLPMLQAVTTDSEHGAGLASRSSGSPLPTSLPSWWLGRIAAGGLVVVMLVLAALAVQGAGQSFAAESEWKLAQTEADALSAKQWRGSADEFAILLTHATAAVQRDPENVENRCVLNTYRWRWSELRNGNKPHSADTSAQVRQDSHEILDDLNVARQDCPVYGPAFYLTALIEKYVFAAPLADLHAQQAYELSQTDTLACLLAAREDVEAGRWNDSMIKLRRYLSLGGNFDSVIDLYVRTAGRPDLAMELAENDEARLGQLANAFRGDPRYKAQADQIDARVFELLKQRSSQEGAPAGELLSFAQEALKRNDLPAAIAAYRKAITLDYGNADWHLALANLLAQSHQVPEAMSEARVCLRLKPEMPAAKQLLGDLSLLPEGRGQ